MQLNQQHLRNSASCYTMTKPEGETKRTTHCFAARTMTDCRLSELVACVAHRTCEKSIAMTDVWVSEKVNDINPGCAEHAYK